jgi:hypothetical protein
MSNKTWEETLLGAGFSIGEIAEIRKARSEGGKRGGLKRGNKGLRTMTSEQRKTISSLGNKVRWSKLNESKLV